MKKRRQVAALQSALCARTLAVSPSQFRTIPVIRVIRGTRKISGSFVVPATNIRKIVLTHFSAFR